LSKAHSSNVRFSNVVQVTITPTIVDLTMIIATSSSRLNADDVEAKSKR